MKIHSLSRLIAMPFMIAVAVVMYYLFLEDRAGWFPYLIPLVILLVIIYTYQPQIDYWWHRKHPPALDKRIEKMLVLASDFFKQLDENGKQRFRDRLAIFMHHKAFYLMRKEKEKMPEDIKALISINAITLSFGLEEYFFPKYDYLFAYMHPFPSPDKPYLHSVEVNHGDGVFLFNSDQLYQSMILKNGVFNTGMYAFAEAFLVSNPLSGLALAEEPDAGALKTSEDPSFENVIRDIGYKEVNLKAILVSLFFTHPEFVREHYPDMYNVVAQQVNNPDRSPSAGT